MKSRSREFKLPNCGNIVTITKHGDLMEGLQGIARALLTDHKDHLGELVVKVEFEIRLVNRARPGMRLHATPQGYYDGALPDNRGKILREFVYKPLDLVVDGDYTPKHKDYLAI